MATIDIKFDNIDNLPVDKNIPSHSEIQIVDTVFKQKYTFFEKILSGTKDILIVGLLFLLCLIPQVDDLIKKAIPSTKNSVYFLLLTKTLIFMFLYFLIKNIYLVRK